MEPFVAARDEKFFDDRAYLVTVDPASLTIVSAHVEDGVDRDRWAVSLGLDQIKTQHAIIGLAGLLTDGGACIGIEKALCHLGVDRSASFHSQLRSISIPTSRR